jgi:hypothetical protein
MKHIAVGGEIRICGPVTVRVANRSDAPIYDVNVMSTWYPTMLSISEIPPGDVATARVEIDVPEDLFVPESSDFAVDWTLNRAFEIPELLFTDALGRRWSRTEDHRLRGISAEGLARSQGVLFPSGRRKESSKQPKGR